MEDVMSALLGGFDGRGSGVFDENLIASLRGVDDGERDDMAADSTIENTEPDIDQINLAER